MKKFLSLALVFSMLLALAMPAMAAGGVSLVSDADSRYIEVSNGYSGIVTYRDNKKTYSMEVTGNGRYFIGLQRDFTGQLKLVGSYGDEEPERTIIGTRTVKTTTFKGYAANLTFSAEQKTHKGPNANFVTAEITEKYTVVTKK